MKKLFENWKRYLNEAGTYKRVMQQTADGRMVGKNVYVPPPDDPYDPPKRKYPNPTVLQKQTKHKIEDNYHLMQYYSGKVYSDDSLSRWSQVYPGDHIAAAEKLLGMEFGEYVFKDHEDRMKKAQEDFEQLQQAYANNDTREARMLEKFMNKKINLAKRLTSQLIGPKIEDLKTILSMASNIKAYVDEELEIAAKDEGFQSAEEMMRSYPEETKKAADDFLASNEQEHLPKINELKQKLDKILKRLGM